MRRLCARGGTRRSSLDLPVMDRRVTAKKDMLYGDTKIVLLGKCRDIEQMIDAFCKVAKHLDQLV